MDKTIPKFKGFKSYEEELNNKKNLNLIRDEKIDSNKKEMDNKRRLETLKEKQNREKTQQLLVKEAINNNIRVNKRIVFNSDNDSEDNKQQLNEEKLKSNNNKSLVKAKQLFESDSDNSDEEEKSDNEFEMNLNKKMSDKNAEKLIALNSRFAHDVRFQIDERFLDLDNNKDNDDHEEVIDEKEKNMHLLEEVLGKKLKPIIRHKEKSSESNSNNNSGELFISRFDPKNEKTSIYEVSSSASKKKVSFDNKVLEKQEKEVIAKEEKVENVSKEVYYEVSSALKESLANKEQEFSLTQMFGNEDNLKNRDVNQEHSLKAETIIHKSSKNLNSLRNPFRYDSSSSEEEDDDNKIVVTHKNQTAKRIPDIQQKFFFSDNDPRFDEDVFYQKDLMEKAKNNWKERQLMIIKAMGVRKRSAKKNIKSAQKRSFKAKNSQNKRFKSS